MLSEGDSLELDESDEPEEDSLESDELELLESPELLELSELLESPDPEFDPFELAELSSCCWRMASVRSLLTLVFVSTLVRKDGTCAHCRRCTDSNC